MAYGYQANGDGEITMEEGKEVVIIDTDGEHIFQQLIPQYKQLTHRNRWLGLDAHPLGRLRWHNSCGIR
jgi:hypothetical protein